MADDTARQLELWTLLADTRVVEDAAGTALVPWQAEDRDAEAPGRATARKDKRRSGPIPLNDKPRYAIKAARYGNRHILVPRRD
jgi:hypothetical protein